MNKEEILDTLKEFADELNVGTLMTDPFRWILWMIIRGLGWILDKLEDVVDKILFLRQLYNHDDINSFLDDIRPILIILLALNLAYIGYLVILKKNFNREAMAANLVVALMIIVALGQGMTKAEGFTYDAIDAIDETNPTDRSADKIIKDNITDLGYYDSLGWDKDKVDDDDDKNNINANKIREIEINQPLNEDTVIKENKDDELSKDGKKIVEQKAILLNDDEYELIDLDDGSWITDITQEYYYRYDVNWFTAIFTLLIMAFVLVTIAVKLAKLFFELTFNYLLAIIVAPADIHSGQKMKQILQNIISIFVVTILMFLSMKVYMIGVDWIGDSMKGLPYLIAMLGFAVAVIDGPNIVERLFGIDAGLKSGWGAIAGSYALAKGGGSMAKGMGKGAKNMATGNAGNKANQADKGGKQQSSGNGNVANMNDYKQGNEQNDQQGGQQGGKQKNNQGQGKETNGKQGSEGSSNSDSTGNVGEGSQSTGIEEEMKAKDNKNGGQQESRPTLQEQMGHSKGGKKGKGQGGSGVGAAATTAAQTAATTAGAAEKARKNVGGGAGQIAAGVTSGAVTGSRQQTTPTGGGSSNGISQEDVNSGHTPTGGGRNGGGSSPKTQATPTGHVPTGGGGQSQHQVNTNHTGGGSSSGGAAPTSGGNSRSTSPQIPNAAPTGHVPTGGGQSGGGDQHINSTQTVNDGGSGGRIMEDQTIHHTGGGQSQHQVNTNHTGGGSSSGGAAPTSGGNSGSTSPQMPNAAPTGHVPTGGGQSGGGDKHINSTQTVNDGGSGGRVIEDQTIHHKGGGGQPQHQVNTRHTGSSNQGSKSMLSGRDVGDFQSKLDQHRKERGYSIRKSKPMKRGKKR